MIWCGGTLALQITNTLQGLLCFPLLVVFIIFLMMNFSWSKEIVPVMLDRTPGESLLNPYDISKLRDFNLFAFCVTAFALLLHRASWIGDGASSSGKTPL